MGQCPRCGAASNEGDVFCGSCGNDLRAAQQPTAPMPQRPAPQQPQQPYTPQPAAHAQPQQPYSTPTSGQPPQKSRTGLVITIVVVALLGLCACVGVAGFALFRFAPVKKVITEVESSAGSTGEAASETTAEREPSSSPAASSGAATSLDALKTKLPSGWVHELAEETPERKVYWAGPPNSEWMSIYVVEKRGTTWEITSEGPFNATSAEEPSAGDAKPSEDVVRRFRTAIKEGRTRDSQSLTIDPLRSDPASAQYANGEFLSFKIAKTEPAGDGTFWVYTDEKWKSGTEKWKFHVVSTEVGLRISELEPW